MMLQFRVAEEKDVWALMALYQKMGSTFTEDPLFLDFFKLKQAVCSAEARWFLSEDMEAKGSLDTNGDALVAVVSVLFDREQGIAKMSRMMINPDVPKQKECLRDLVRRSVQFIEESEPQIDVIYSTTLTLPIQLQEVTLQEGFHILGVFPNALGVDQSKLNGITVYYPRNVLASKRHAEFTLHPLLEPFFKLAQNSLGLPGLEIASTEATQQIPKGYEATPPLELIEAPLLVERKFTKLKTHQSMVLNFYPFLKPNALVCDPDQSVEIYGKIVDQIRFAAIIGEHLERSVDPVELYLKVSQILKDRGVSYIEIINDAADVVGTECILRAGFTPCAYLPAFKRQGDSRRDYVVYGKSFEYLCRPNRNVHKGYLDFFKQYFRLERRNYLFPKS